MFHLHPTLQKNLIDLGSLELCKLMLMPDSDNPWLVLIPQVADIKEWHCLSWEDQKQLLTEINDVSKFLEQEFKPDKINIGSLGNMVPQLHVHIIARFKNDKAWPGAIWGTIPSVDNEILIKWKMLVCRHFKTT